MAVVGGVFKANVRTGTPTNVLHLPLSSQR